MADSWYLATLIPAAIAAVGFAGKQIYELLLTRHDAQRERQARLISLHSLLRASKTTFLVQNERRSQLRESLKRTAPELVSRRPAGYDDLFEEAHPTLTESQRDLFDIIRAITIHATRRINQALFEWVKDDVYFRAQAGTYGPEAEVAADLAKLEVHLRLWEAKYQAWIPDHPERCLVYLADEKRHGMRFPRELQRKVAALLETWGIAIPTQPRGTPAAAAPTRQPDSEV